MTSEFYGLCYHYIRKENNDPFPRIFGTKINDFNEHVKICLLYTSDAADE